MHTFPTPEKPKPSEGGLRVLKGSLALTYFLTRNVQYHWREGVSRTCSGREGVVPPCYGHQTKLVTEGVCGCAKSLCRKGRSKEVVVIDAWVINSRL